jgi:hypothetical protein
MWDLAWPARSKVSQDGEMKAPLLSSFGRIEQSAPSDFDDHRCTTLSEGYLSRVLVFYTKGLNLALASRLASK